MSGTNNTGVFNGYPMGPTPIPDGTIFLASASDQPGALMYNYTLLDIATAAYSPTIFSAPPVIGDVTPNAGNFTFLTCSVAFQTSGSAILHSLSVETSGLIPFLTIQQFGGPSIYGGPGVPNTTQPKGSLFLRTDGAVGSTMYVSQGAGVWHPVAGV